jgi:hypothetical protein
VFDFAKTSRFITQLFQEHGEDDEYQADLPPTRQSDLFFLVEEWY